MELDLKWLLGILGTILGIVINKGWDAIKSFNDKKEKDMTLVMAQLTVAVTELKIQMATLTEKLSPMPKVQSDLNELHAKVRELGARIQ